MKFYRLFYTVNLEPFCTKDVSLTDGDFSFFDKDGYELTLAERRYYRAMGFPVSECLHHKCWQEPWLEIADSENIFFDHCLILHRAGFSGDALEQLHEIKHLEPRATYLINSIPKWGFDFALDGIDSQGNCFEVVHIEYDSRDVNKFIDQVGKTEKQVYNIDWVDAEIGRAHV